MSFNYVYITGCDSGFGKLSLALFEKEGLKVFAGVFLKDTVDKLKLEYPSGQILPILLNVTSEASVAEASRFIKETLQKNNGKLIGVVNNAGILVQPCPTEWQSLKDFRDMFEVNVLGMVSVTNSVLPLIRSSKGRIVCVSSLLGRFGAPTQSAYCASKHAVQGYADSLRRDMIPWGVSVHIIEPGVFPNTGLYERFEKGLDSVWERLSPELQEDYGEAHYKFTRKLIGHAKDNFGTLDSSLVSKAYVHAICNSSPKYRYRIGLDCKYGGTMLVNMHESTSDTLLSMSDPRIPYIKPAKAPSDGRSIAIGRMHKGWDRWFIMTAIACYLYYRIRKSAL
jgi:NADP-dependent 3-hydroxy acid dehydrogenase YdfG